MGDEYRWTCLLALSRLALAADKPSEAIAIPKVVDARLKIEQFAAEPDIVTPTGIAVDHSGRVLVIESHTHFRPADTRGRRPIASACSKDTRRRRPRRQDHELLRGDEVHDEPGRVSRTARSSSPPATTSFACATRDGDGQADDRTRDRAPLETDGQLSAQRPVGLRLRRPGNVYFGLGENLGADYKLIGSDGTALTGGGEGGNIYRCRPDGDGLTRIATGFWNPFHLTFDAFGRLFAVDNDPDSRAALPLVHIVHGGDYGYRFRNGRKGRASVHRLERRAARAPCRWSPARAKPRAE